MNGRIEIGLPFFLPDPEGAFHAFALVNSPLVEDPKRGSEYATYFGVGIDEPTRRVRVSLTPRGIHALVLGEPAPYMVERAFPDDASMYTSHYVEDLPRAVDQGRKHGRAVGNFLSPDLTAPYSSSSMRRAKIAIVVRPAVVNFQDQDGDGQDERFVNTKALIQDVVSDMALVYEVDVGLRLVQVAEPYRSLIIYVDNDRTCSNNCESDPYCDCCFQDGFCLTCENRHVLDGVVGFSRYDIGHMFSHVGGYFAPGLATHSDQYPLIDCGPSEPETQDLCRFGPNGIPDDGDESTHKARSMCTWVNAANFGSYFWVDYVAHEVGHTLNAYHTFDWSACGGATADAYEPGSGSTIMGYAGQTCGGNGNYAEHADPYFHTATISRVRDFIQQSTLLILPTANSPPVCSAGPDYLIPKLTPFELMAASASDPDGDALMYCWEQIDVGTGSTDLADKAAGPLIRSFLPTPNPARLIPRTYFNPEYLNPALEMSERITSYDRDLNFRLTVRDGYGGVAMDSMKVDVVRLTSGGNPVGPFKLTYPNAGGDLFGQITVTWDPAGTQESPISCQSVLIQLTRNATSPTPPWEDLGTFTNNGAAENVTLPVVASPTLARIRVRAVGNIFLDVSDVSFTLIPPP